MSEPLNGERFPISQCGSQEIWETSWCHRFELRTSWKKLGGESEWETLSPPSATIISMPLSKSLNPQLPQWSCIVAGIRKLELYWAATGCECGGSLNVKQDDADKKEKKKEKRAKPNFWKWYQCWWFFYQQYRHLIPHSVTRFCYSNVALACMLQYRNT